MSASDADFSQKKYIVYYDENYHSSWIYPTATKKIVNYLTSEERGEKKFTKLSAKKLRKWMEITIEEKRANETVTVISQDIIPDVLAEDFSPSIILRSYLDAGGRIVWIGNIPFWLQGKDKRQIKETEQPWVEWGFMGIFSILGLNAEFNYSPANRVTITREGEAWKLRKENSWYGTRPIREGRETVKVLAESSAKRPKMPQLLQTKEKEKISVINFLSEIFSLLSLIITVIFAIASAVSSYFYTVQLEFQYLTIAIIFAILAMTLGVPKIYRKVRPKKYANAWIKNFNPSFPNSGFVRIWDCQLYDVTQGMLEDLFAVATHGN
jgi:hypothetical protein